MSERDSLIVLAVPSDFAAEIESGFPSGFRSTGKVRADRFRFGIGEMADYVGLVKDMAELVLTVLGILAVLRSCSKEPQTVTVRDVSGNRHCSLKSSMTDEEAAALMRARFGDKVPS